VPLRDDPTHLLWTGPLVAIGAYYTYVRSHEIIATLFNGMGLIGIGKTNAALTSALPMYTGRSFPLADQTLHAADRFLGFDWVAVLKLFDRCPYFDWIAQAAYQSIFAQLPFLVLALALTRQPERLYRALTALNVGLCATSVIAVFFPAFGPYEFLQVSAADHPNIMPIIAAKMTDPIVWLRAAVFTDPAPDFTIGLISFPSFHSTAAAIYVWMAWRTPLVRWLALAVNGLMLIATPVHGSHYLVDVLAGLALAAAAIVGTTYLFRRIRRDRQPALSAAGPMA
jgi:membrane-associated phospholipid phosphatase